MKRVSEFEGIVERLPKCEICGGEAEYWCKTRNGAWMELCSFHFKGLGEGLGDGRGVVLEERGGSMRDVEDMSVEELREELARIRRERRGVGRKKRVQAKEKRVSRRRKEVRRKEKEDDAIDMGEV